MLKPTLSFLTVLRYGILFFAVNCADAAIVNYSFNGTLDSGSLSGQTFSGAFSYDDATLVGANFESLDLTSFAMNFLSTNFSLSDADSDVTPSVDFMDGGFLGVSFLLNELGAFDPNFSLISGLFDATDAYFAYTPASAAGAGYGSITFTKETVSSVPVPAALWLFATAFPGLLMMSGKKPAKRTTA